MKAEKISKKTAVYAAGLLTLLLLLPFAAVITVRAAYMDYKVYNADWEDRTADEAKLYGIWDKSEDKTSYTVNLYKGTRRVGAKQVGYVEKIDFSQFINNNIGGSGTYYFTVQPTKGGSELMITSDEFEVTSAMVTAIRNRIQKERKEAIAAAGGGWVKGPGDIWIYYDKEGNQLKNCWIEDNGHKYYLDKNGFMLTGWQILNSIYYYLEPKGTVDHPLGSLWTDTTTPDGYRVDETGARVTSEGVQEKEVTYKLLASVAISLKEIQEPGKCTLLTDVTSSYGTVSNIQYSSDPAGWTENSVGKVSFTVKVDDAYRLQKGFRVNCNRASGVNVLSHTSQEFNAELWYSPKYVLETPGDFYVSDGTVLRWNKVNHASEYSVKITVEETVTDNEGIETTKNNAKSVTTSHNFVDLALHDIYEDTVVKSITVAANASNTKKYINSSTATISDLPKLIEERSIPGYFDSNSVGLYYYDESGERVTGWKELLGNWYYFKENGYATTGWYRDSKTNYWYYFDEKGRMVTGTVTLADGTYHLNDGSRTDIPLGAMIR